MMTCIARSVVVVAAGCGIAAINTDGDDNVVSIVGKWKRDFVLNRKLAETKQARDLAARLERQNVDYYLEFTRDGKCTRTIVEGTMTRSQFSGPFQVEKDDGGDIHVSVTLVDSTRRVPFSVVVSADGILKLLDKNRKCVEVFSKVRKTETGKDDHVPQGH